LCSLNTTDQKNNRANTIFFKKNYFENGDEKEVKSESSEESKDKKPPEDDYEKDVLLIQQGPDYDVKLENRRGDAPGERGFVQVKTKYSSTSPDPTKTITYITEDPIEILETYTTEETTSGNKAIVIRAKCGNIDKAGSIKDVVNEIDNLNRSGSSGRFCIQAFLTNTAKKAKKAFDHFGIFLEDGKYLYRDPCDHTIINNKEKCELSVEVMKRKYYRSKGDIPGNLFDSLRSIVYNWPVEVSASIFGYLAISPFFYELKDDVNVFILSLVGAPNGGKSKLANTYTALYGSKKKRGDDFDSPFRLAYHTSKSTFPVWIDEAEDVKKDSVIGGLKDSTSSQLDTVRGSLNSGLKVKRFPCFSPIILSANKIHFLDRPAFVSRILRIEVPPFEKNDKSAKKFEKNLMALKNAPRIGPTFIHYVIERVQNIENGLSDQLRLLSLFEEYKSKLDSKLKNYTARVADWWIWIRVGWQLFYEFFGFDGIYKDIMEDDDLFVEKVVKPNEAQEIRYEKDNMKNLIEFVDNVKVNFRFKDEDFSKVVNKAKQKYGVSSEDLVERNREGLGKCYLLDFNFIKSFNDYFKKDDELTMSYIAQNLAAMYNIDREKVYRTLKLNKIHKKVLIYPVEVIEKNNKLLSIEDVGDDEPEPEKHSEKEIPNFEVEEAKEKVGQLIKNHKNGLTFEEIENLVKLPDNVDLHYILKELTKDNVYIDDLKYKYLSI